MTAADRLDEMTARTDWTQVHGPIVRGSYAEHYLNDVPALAGALRAVLTLHAPHTDQWVGPRCSECRAPYPCQTADEIEGALT